MTVMDGVKIWMSALNSNKVSQKCMHVRVNAQPPLRTGNKQEHVQNGIL